MATARAIPQTYLDLVHKFPLVRIRNDRHLGEAQKVLDELLQEDLDKGGEMYLDALTDLIEVYETATIPTSDASPVDVLKGLIDSCCLTQMELAKTVGIAQSTISAILNGSRKMTADHISRFAKHFNVSPSVFIGS